MGASGRLFTLRWGPTPSACHGSLALAATIGLRAIL